MGIVDVEKWRRPWRIGGDGGGQEEAIVEWRSGEVKNRSGGIGGAVKWRRRWRSGGGEHVARQRLWSCG